MPKPLLLSLLMALILMVWATNLFADRPVYVMQRQPYVGPPVQPVAGVTSHRPAENLARATDEPMSGGVAGVTSHRPAGNGAVAPVAYCPPMLRRYPKMQASMYPCPVPNVPVQVGGTVFTNQALAPHEMMYPHKYKSLYPPFYYRVKGCWLWTPFGMESHDKWELQGTEVRVKYHSHISPLTGFFPTFNR